MDERPFIKHSLQLVVQTTRHWVPGCGVWGILSGYGMWTPEEKTLSDSGFPTLRRGHAFDATYVIRRACVACGEA